MFYQLNRIVPVDNIGVHDSEKDSSKFSVASRQRKVLRRNLKEVAVVAYMDAYRVSHNCERYIEESTKMGV